MLFAHGARDPRWAAPFEQTARRVSELCPERQVVNAYLEFMLPDIDAAAQQLVEGGCTDIDVLPLFLGTGGHVRKDLPLKLDALRLRWPHVRWHLHPAIGESPDLIGAMAHIASTLPSIPFEAAP